MRPLERVPAVRRLRTDKADVFAMEITGEFTAADAENLCGLLEGAFAVHSRVDLLVRLVDLDEVEVSRLSPETTTFMKEHVAQHVGRCAIIDDGGWATRVTRLFDPGDGIETRHFATEDEPAAWQWLGTSEIVEKV